MVGSSGPTTGQRASARSSPRWTPAPRPRCAAALRAAVEVGDFGYLPTGPGRGDGGGVRGVAARPLRLAGRARRRPPVPDVLRGLEIVIAHFTAPGRPVILPTPAYMPFLDRAGPAAGGRSSRCPPRRRRPARPRPRRHRRRLPRGRRAAGADQPAQPARARVHRRRAARGVRGGRPARRPGLRRRDPRAADLPRAPARALRHALGDGGRAHRHRRRRRPRRGTCPGSRADS